MEDIIKAKDVQEILGMSAEWVRTKSIEGFIPVLLTLPSGQRRYSRAAIEELRDSMRPSPQD